MVKKKKEKKRERNLNGFISLFCWQDILGCNRNSSEKKGSQPVRKVLLTFGLRSLFY